MNTLTDFPVKHIENNLAFGRDGSVWAYYEIEGFAYDHRDTEQMKTPFYNQMGFLTKNEDDLHYLLIPYQMDGGDIIDRTIADVERKEFVLKKHGLRYLRNLKKPIERGDLSRNSNQYHEYIGIQLNPRKNKFREGNAGTHFIGAAKAFVEGLNSPVRKAVGLDPYDILQTEIDAWQEQAKVLEEEITASFSSPARRLSTAEMLFIAEYSFSMTTESGKLESKELSDKVSGEDEKGQTVEAVRPKKKVYYDLQNAEIIPHDAKNLKLRKTVEDEEVEQFVRYLVIDSMDAENFHPGFEWLYRLQTELPFPIGVSIRACHKPNKKIRKELSNALLGFTDQRNEAAKASVNVDKSVMSSEAGAVQMEEFFQKSGHPSYSCSFVLRLTADSEPELKARVEQVRRELGKKGITLQSPYGDALVYFMEFIPTSKRISSDYWMEVSPGVLAAMMFGATTNIGDNRGFLIGFTKKLKKPVFIQPDLAAKNFAGVKNIFDSLAVMVAGETGKGKSVFMNLYAVLSALTLGSQVLIIDPKGDRKHWGKGLPFIPPEHISVWTLGESAEDAGCLDPFRTSTNIREAKDICMDILSYLAGVDLDNDKYALLSDAVEVAGDHADPCIEVVVNHLNEVYKNPPEHLSEARKQDLESLIGTLETIQKNQLANLLFGKIGQDYRSLNVNKPMQVLMVQNLILPEGEKKKRPVEKISEGILISLTAFTKQYTVKTDRSIHTLILQDEAKSIERSDMGRELIDWIERKGRYYNTTLLKGTQNASDYKDATNIGMKACFQLYQAAEAEQMLSFYNLPITRNNVATIQNLKRGETLFQDIYGRSAVISINTIFQEFLDAFDSSTANAAERAYEEERQKLEV